MAKPPGAGSATSKSSDRSGKSDHSTLQDEFKTGTRQTANTAPQSTGGGPGAIKAQVSRSKSSANVSSAQDEFQTSASSEANTAPQSTSPSAIDPAEAASRQVPLPDLTKGIPSTIDAELESSVRADSTSLNITEDPTQSASGGARGPPRAAYVSSADRRRGQLANFMFTAFLVLAIAGPVYLGRNWESEEEERKHSEAPSGWGVGLFYNRARARLADMLAYYNEPTFPKLLPDVDPQFERPFTLVLSLEDLLVHSEWTRENGWRVAKRPGVDYFLRYLQQYYELVIFTSVVSHIAEPVIAKLDPFRIVTWPLFREATKYMNGEHIKVGS